MNLSWEIMFQQNIFSIIYKENRLVFIFLLFIKKRKSMHTLRYLYVQTSKHINGFFFYYFPAKRKRFVTFYVLIYSFVYNLDLSIFLIAVIKARKILTFTIR